MPQGKGKLGPLKEKKLPNTKSCPNVKKAGKERRSLPQGFAGRKKGRKIKKSDKERRAVDKEMGRKNRAPQPFNRKRLKPTQTTRKEEEVDRGAERF